jgi:uncharacterized membrane protein YdbT with pleckstrin-like domain
MSENLSTVEPDSQLTAQLGPDESLEWVVEKQQRAYLFGALVSAIVGLVIGFFLSFILFIATWALAGSFLLAFVVGVLTFFGPPVVLGGLAFARGFLSTVQYAATDQRFIVLKDGLTGTNTESVQIDQVRDVEYSEGPFDKFFGTGDITIEPEMGADTIVFDNVKDEQDLLQAVRQHAQL